MTLWLCRQLPGITDNADEEELDAERYADMVYTREAALLHPWSGGTAFSHPHCEEFLPRSPALHSTASKLHAAFGRIRSIYIDQCIWTIYFNSDLAMQLPRRIWQGPQASHHTTYPTMPLHHRVICPLCAE